MKFYAMRHSKQVFTKISSQIINQPKEDPYLLLDDASLPKLQEVYTYK